MREREMQQRIQDFLKARMRVVVLPATLGLGLVALSACPKDGEDATHDGSVADTSGATDTGLVTKYMAQLPDAGGAVAVYSAPMPDAMIAPEYMAQLPDAGGAVARYMAQLPDAGASVAKYMAQTPDAGVALRYMAQMPDAGSVVALYMALNPS